MEREIRFRGKDKDANWVTGDLIHGVGSCAGEVYILPNKINLAYIPNCDPLNGVCVASESVGQFTGLTDKNGKEIYEGIYYVLFVLKILYYLLFMMNLKLHLWLYKLTKTEVLN